ncbi:MAG: S1/P1 Nuclease [Bacteroidetes bacterium]|nr:S1/P1 Nuclease [Bacteroidota bacterium]
MQQKNLHPGLLIASILVVGIVLCSWGFWGHQRINRMSVFTLPPEMLGFYKQHLEFVTEHAVDPDKRRYAIKEEAPRHYIDLDHYGENPFDTLPKKWDEAVKKFTEDTLNEYGIVPWHVVRVLGYLTAAMRNGNVEKILHYSADLGHYVGDAHVPLHCTQNYNGQLTGQHGIHGFWESRIPESYGNDYDYLVGRAEYIKDPQEYIWNVVRESYAAHDSVLRFERILNAKYDQDKKYAFEQRGVTTVKTYSKAYTADYDKLLNGMVERRMRSSIIAVGSFWYTAWVNAGQPNLDSLKAGEMSSELKKQLEEEDKMWRSGKVQNSKGHSDD